MSSNQQALLHGGGGGAPPVLACIADPYYDTPDSGDVVFLMHADGTNGSSTFTDVSASAHTCTAVNGMTVTTANPKFGTGSVGGDGSGGDAVIVTSSSDLNMGSGDFTVECWVALTATSGLARGVIGKGSSMYGLSTLEFYIFVETSGVRARISNGTTFLTLTSSTFFGATNVYYHVALVRSGNNFTLYGEGNELAVGTLSGSLPVTAHAMYVAGNPDENGIFGLIDEIRITKGTALYSGATYTVPTAAFTDPSPAIHTVLSLHGEALVDSSSNPKTLTNNGVTISTAQSKFGGSSMYFDGVSNVLEVPDSTDTRLGTGDWTIEFWVRASNYPNTAAGAGLISKRSSVASVADTWSILLSTDGSGQLAISEISTGTFTNRNIGAPIALNTWLFFAACRSANTIYCFIDGVLELSYVTSHNFDAATYPITIGWNVAAGFFNGYIDDLRVTKGAARYTANFTPPTLTFCDSETPTYVGEVNGTDYPDGQQISIAQGVITVANPWVKLSGIAASTSTGSLTAVQPNRSVAISGSTITVSQGTTVTPDRIAAIAGSSMIAQTGNVAAAPYPALRTSTVGPINQVVNESSGSVCTVNIFPNGTFTLLGILDAPLASGTWIDTTNAAFDIATIAVDYQLERIVPISIALAIKPLTYPTLPATLGAQVVIQDQEDDRAPANCSFIFIIGPAPTNPRYGEAGYNAQITVILQNTFP